MPDPAVSVIMTVRNGERFLDAAVRSIREQSLEELELIAVDNGSTDGSLEILRDHERADDRVRVISQPDEGVYGGRNRAVPEARAPLIAWMDADDVALPARLERQVGYLDEHPEVSVVGGAVKLIDDEGGPLRSTIWRPSTHEAIAATLVGECTALNDPTVMMRRDAFLSVGGYRPRRRAPAFDYDLWLRMLPDHRFANLEETVLCYRIHGGQDSLSKWGYTEYVETLVRAAYHLRQQGRPDPIDDWDESIDLDLVAQLGLSPFEESRVYAALISDLAYEGDRSRIGDLSRRELLDRLWQRGLAGAAPRTSLVPMIKAPMAYWATGQRLRALRFATRLWLRAPRRVTTALVRHGLLHR